jgi:hypothetical protein
VVQFNCRVCQLCPRLLLKHKADELRDRNRCPSKTPNSFLGECSPNLEHSGRKALFSSFFSYSRRHILCLSSRSATKWPAIYIVLGDFVSIILRWRRFLPQWSTPSTGQTLGSRSERVSRDFLRCGVSGNPRVCCILVYDTTR